MTLLAMLDAAATGAVDVADGWGQGRATYGGLVAGLLVARAEVLTDDVERRLRVANTTFVGPVEPGAAQIDGQVLRAGSGATTVEARLLQGGEVRATLVASFARPRETAVTVDEAGARPTIPDASEVEPVPFFAGLPEFLQHVELRFAAGGAMFSGCDEAAFGGWMRWREPPARMGDRELIALTDAWPPAIAPRFAGPAPMSSLAWTFEPVGEAPGTPYDPAAHWQYDARTLTASGGFAQTTARVWDASGTLRALSHQTVAYFR
ncbi:MAG: thioesterase family protein [Patulibacter minatonensis]